MNYFIKPLCLGILFMWMIAVNCNIKSNEGALANKQLSESEKAAEVIKKKFNDLRELVKNAGIINKVLIVETEIGKGNTAIVWKGILLLYSIVF